MVSEREGEKERERRREVSDVLERDGAEGKGLLEEKQRRSMLRGWLLLGVDVVNEIEHERRLMR